MTVFDVLIVIKIMSTFFLQLNITIKARYSVHPQKNVIFDLKTGMKRSVFNLEFYK